jgi:hypothetical protein
MCAVEVPAAAFMRCWEEQMVAWGGVKDARFQLYLLVVRDPGRGREGCCDGAGL